MEEMRNAYVLVDKPGRKRPLRMARNSGGGPELLFFYFILPAASASISLFSFHIFTSRLLSQRDSFSGVTFPNARAV
jgi:hypothetical protein